MVLQWLAGTGAGRRLGLAHGAALFLVMAAAVACADEPVLERMDEVDGRGSWMFTSEQEAGTENPARRLVATKLDEGLTVEIHGQQGSPCMGPTADLARVGQWGDGDAGPFLLRLTEDGFRKDPDLLPTGFYGLPSCPLIWQPDRAVLLATTERPTRHPAQSDYGLFLATVDSQGSPVATRLDAGTGDVEWRSSWPLLTPKQTKLFYTTQSAAYTELYRVDLDRSPPTGRLVQRMKGIISGTASERWLVYFAGTDPTTLQVADLSGEETSVSSLPLPPMTAVELHSAAWSGDHHLLFALKRNSGAPALFFRFAADAVPRVVDVALGNIEPMSGQSLVYTDESIAFIFQENYGDARRRGVARLEVRASESEPTVIFEIDAANASGTVLGMQASQNSQAALVRWIDADERPHIVEVDVASGIQFSFDAHIQECETRSIDFRPLDPDDQMFIVACWIGSGFRVFGVNRSSPGDRIQLEGLDTTRGRSPWMDGTWRWGTPGISASLSGPPAENPYKSVSVYSLTGELRALREPEGHLPMFAGMIQLE